MDIEKSFGSPTTEFGDNNDVRIGNISSRTVDLLIPEPLANCSIIDGRTFDVFLRRKFGYEG